MFKYFVFFALVAAASAAALTSSISNDAGAEVKEWKSDVRPDGFDIALDTSNGIHSIESGDALGNVKGEYEYVAPGGEHIKVTYIANENGYQPISDSLPTPPPVPEAILKSLDYIRAHPGQEESKKN